MKNTLEASNMRFRQMINLLARHVVEKDLTKERLQKEIDTRFCDASRDQKEDLMKHILHKSYISAWITNRPSGTSPLTIEKPQSLENFRRLEKNLKGCFALKLTRHICKSAEKAGASSTAGWTEDFSETCLKSFSLKSFPGEAADRELLLIAIKQSLAIIRKTSLFTENGNAFGAAGRECSVFSLYIDLLSAFWEKVSWEEIFPSNPEAAREIQRNRHILIDLVAHAEDVFKLDDIANQFFDMTGFGRINDLFLISFLDFYFFTWLSHFGIVKYLSGDDHEAVRLEKTPQGQELLRILQGHPLQA